MKNISTQKEILLVTNNSFAQREWCNKQKGDDRTFSAQEQMEEVCANGLIFEILPELFEADKESKLYLWQMRPGFSFVELEYGEFPIAIEKEYSIDPHNSLSCMCLN